MLFSLLLLLTVSSSSSSSPSSFPWACFFLSGNCLLSPLGDDFLFFFEDEDPSSSSIESTDGDSSPVDGGAGGLDDVDGDLPIPSASRAATASPSSDLIALEAVPLPVDFVAGAVLLVFFFFFLVALVVLPEDLLLFDVPFDEED